MPTTCCAYGCTNRLTKQNTSISFHRFPSDENRKNEWIKAVRRQNWFPNKNTRICSVHFEESMFDRTMNRVLLKENSVPSIFKAFPSMQKMPRHDQNKYGKTYPSSQRKKGQPYRKKCKAVNSCSAELNGDVKSAAPDDWITIEDSKEVKFVIEIENADNDVVLPMNDDDDSCHNNSSSLSGKCEQNEPKENAESSVEKDLNIVTSHCQSVLKQQMNSDEKDMELISTESATGFEYVEEHICEKIEVKEEMISSDAQLDLEGETELNELNDTHDNKLSEKLNNDAHDKELTDELNDDTHKNELTNNKLTVNGVISEISNTNRLKKRDLVEVIQPKSGKVVLNKKLLACVYCGVYFSEHKELLFHQISVHGLKGFICFLCGRNITYNKNEDSLACHILEYHKDISSTDTERRLKNVNSFMKEQPSLLTSVTRMSLASSKISLTFHQIPLVPTQSSLAASQTSFVSSQISSMSSSKKGNSLGNCVQNELHCDVANTMSDYNAYVTELIKEKDTSGNVIFWSSPTNICSKTKNLADGCSESKESVVVKNDVDNLDMPAEVTSGNVIFWSTSTNICSKANNIADGCSESEEISVVKNDVDNLDMPAEVTSGNVIFWSSSTNICSKANNIADGCSESEEIVAVKNDVDNLDMSSEVTSGNAIYRSSSTNVSSKANNIADGCNESEEIVTVKNDVDNLAIPSEENTEFSRSNLNIIGTSFENQENAMEGLEQVENTNVLRVYYCDVCHKIFKSRRYSLLHMKLHTHKKVPCKTCEKIFYSLGELKVHEKVHKKLPECKECGKVLHGKGQLSRHLLIHTERLCDLCGEVCTSMYSLTQHKVKHNYKPVLVPRQMQEVICHTCGKFVRNLPLHMKVHEDKSQQPTEGATFCCDTCGKLFKSRSQFKHHLTSHTSDYAPTYTCTECPKKFFTRCNLTQHALQHKEPKFECAHCDRRFRRFSQLRLHSRVHRFGTNSERLYRCFICQAAFKTYEDRFKHQMQHTQEEIDKYKKEHYKKRTNKKNPKVNGPLKKFKCDFCEKKFSSKISLLMHCYTHTGEKPLKCSFCEACFGTKIGLKSHELIHTGERPYKCNVCEKAFRGLNTLNQHMSVHLTEMPFVCDVCKKGFNRRFSLICHLRVHTNERPYPCKICGRAFKQSSDRRKHELLHKKK